MSECKTHCIVSGWNKLNQQHPGAGTRIGKFSDEFWFEKSVNLSEKVDLGDERLQIDDRRGRWFKDMQSTLKSTKDELSQVFSEMNNSKNVRGPTSLDNADGGG